jgi:hypothetical protein
MNRNILLMSSWQSLAKCSFSTFVIIHRNTKISSDKTIKTDKNIVNNKKSNMFNVMMKNVLLILILSLLSASCASILYSDKNRQKNNRLVIKTNVTDFSVSPVRPTPIDGWNGVQVGSGSNTAIVDFPKMRSKYKKIKITKQNYESVVIRVKRSPRVSIIAVDFCFAMFPLLVDVFNPDFYKIPQNARNITVEMRFSQNYMTAEYEKINKSSNPEDYTKYIDKYPYSNKTYVAERRRDELEFERAKQNRSEQAIEAFIRNRPQSHLLSTAKKLKDDFVSARMAFEQAQIINTPAAYASFLKDHSTSVHRADAIAKMVDAAEREMVSDGRMESAYSFGNEYLMKYREDLGASYNNRLNDFKGVLAKRIIENANRIDDDLNSSAVLWNEYQKTLVAFPQITKIEEIEAKKPNIYSVLFYDLKSKNTEGSQHLIVDSYRDGFDNFFTASSTVPCILEIILNSNDKEGSIVLYDVKAVHRLIVHRKNKTNNGDIFSYNYQGQQYHIIDDVHREEMSFTGNELVGMQSIYNYDGKKLMSLMISNLTGGLDGNIEYYRNGLLVRRDLYTDDIIKCTTEFDGSKNLTHEQLNRLIDTYANEVKSQDVTIGIATAEAILKLICAGDERLITRFGKLVDEHQKRAKAEQAKIEAKNREAAEKFLQLIFSGLSGGSRESSGSGSGSYGGQGGSGSRSSDCRRCNGTGRQMCSVCNGSGRRKCSSCYGIGTTWRNGERIVCQDCNGRGENICSATRCDGSGTIPCGITCPAR